MGFNGGLALMTVCAAYSFHQTPAAGAAVPFTFGPHFPSLSPAGLIQTRASTTLLLVLVVGITP